MKNKARTLHQAAKVLKVSMQNLKKSKKIDYIGKINNAINNTTEYDTLSSDKIMEKIKSRILRTEDTGKIWEKAICLGLETPFCGPYKYSLVDAERLSQYIVPILISNDLSGFIHTAKAGARYDFTGPPCCPPRYLSAKSTKKDGKVAPQHIGQCMPKTFAERISWSYADDAELKKHIQEDTIHVLEKMEEYTISKECDVFYYNKHKGTASYIKQKNRIDFNLYEYKWSHDWKIKQSCTLSMRLRIRHNDDDKWRSIVEIQFHKKNRTNMAARWHFEVFLDIFKANLTITELKMNITDL
jgi:hypothetical protein